MINKIRTVLTVLTATAVLTLHTFTGVLKVFFNTQSAHLWTASSGSHRKWRIDSVRWLNKNGRWRHYTKFPFIFVHRNKQHWRNSCASSLSSFLTGPSTVPIFFIFMQFLWQFGQITAWRPLTLWSRYSSLPKKVDWPPCNTLDWYSKHPFDKTKYLWI